MLKALRANPMTAPGLLLTVCDAVAKSNSLAAEAPSVLELQHLRAALRAAMAAVDAELTSGGLGGPFAAESLANVMAVHLLRHISSFQAPARSARNELPRAKLRAVLEYVEEHLDASPPLSSSQPSRASAQPTSPRSSSAPRACRRTDTSSGAGLRAPGKCSKAVATSLWRRSPCKLASPTRANFPVTSSALSESRRESSDAGASSNRYHQDSPATQTLPSMRSMAAADGYLGSSSPGRPAVDRISRRRRV